MRHNMPTSSSAMILIFASASFSAWALGTATGMTQSDSPWKYSGWACDTANPGYQTAVEARRDDGKLLGKVLANHAHSAKDIQVCGSPRKEHGFELFIDIRSNWMDNKIHQVNLIAIDQKKQASPIGTFSVKFSTSSNQNQPKPQAGDVVGRELDVQGLGSLGHIGIWDGKHIIEMLNEPGQTQVYKNSWENFTSRTKLWETARPKFPMHTIKTCWSTSCDIHPNRPGELTLAAKEATFFRANQVHAIGATYTLSPIYSTAEPEMRDYTQPHWKRRAIQGKYRCDTFIYDAFKASTDIDNSGVFPYRDVQKMPSSWRTKVGNLYTSLATTPAKLLQKIREF